MLAEYFKNTAINVHSIMADANPVNSLLPVNQRVYKKLPSEFKTGEGVEIAKKEGMPERNFKRFISDNKKLFNKIRWGHYERRY